MKGCAAPLEAAGRRFGFGWDSDNEHLVDSTIKMVDGFRYRVVAEGVEEIGQVDKLFRDMRCDKIQGYYFSAPLPAEKFEKMLFNDPGIE